MAAAKDNMISDAISEEIIRVAEKITMRDGVKNVTVRKILSKMGVTNRVFYNRFHNIDEVLENIYTSAVIKMRRSLNSEFDITKDFFGYVMDVAVKVLIQTYDVKNQFSQYMFEIDSYREANRNWWTDKIKQIVNIGKATGALKKDIDADMLSYTVWCFFRGFNADAVNRKLSKEEAVEKFKFGLNCFFDGIR